MHVMSIADMQRHDAETVTAVGLPASVLIERAAWSAVTLLSVTAPERLHSTRPALILAGSGNNGGDALAVARMLAGQGKAVRILALPARSDEAVAQTAILARWPLAVTPLTSPEALRTELDGCDLVIDGLFGIGLSRPVTGDLAGCVGQVNASGLPVLSLDIPSGLQADTGTVLGTAVQATWTCSFAWPKRGQLVDTALPWIGELWVADIGIPERLAGSGSARVSLPEGCRALLPTRRASQAHKGDCGRVMLVGGSRTMPGAIQLATAAALHGGAGYVTVALPAEFLPMAASRFPAAMFRPLADPDSPDWEDLAPDSGIVAIGPGLGRSAATTRLVEGLLAVPLPVILDADGLNAVCNRPDLIRQRQAPTVLTPHAGEAGRWLGLTAAAVQADRWGALDGLVRMTGATVVLKGARTLIGAPDGARWVNISGSPALARGGSGDLLTGLLAALMAQGLPATEAARAAVWWHGQAGRIAADTHGEMAATWETVLGALPAAARTIPGPPEPWGLRRLVDVSGCGSGDR